MVDHGETTPTPEPKKAEKPETAAPENIEHTGHWPGPHLVAPEFPVRSSGYGSVEWLHEHELSVQQTIDYYNEMVRIARNPDYEPNYRRTMYLLHKYEIEYKNIT